MKFSQDSLVLEATADGLTGEQTWPTEAEMNVGDASVLETIDSAIGRNRRIIPTNVSPAETFLHFYIMIIASNGLRNDESGENSFINLVQFRPNP